MTHMLTDRGRSWNATVDEMNAAVANIHRLSVVTINQKNPTSTGGEGLQAEATGAEDEERLWFFPTSSFMAFADEE